MANQLTPMYGAEALELLERLGVDTAATYELTIAATINALGERDPVEAIVEEYITDEDGYVLTDDEGAPLKRSRVIVLHSLTTHAGDAA